jgi:hypothetical protein
LRLFKKLKSCGTRLDEYVEGKFYRGITTGFNDAFELTNQEKKALVEKDVKSAQIIKPYLRGRDLKRWQLNDEKRWLIFTRRGIDIEKYPAIKKHLSKFKEQLMPTGEKDPKTGKSLTRKLGSYEWFEIQDNIAYWEEFETPKIIMGRFMNNPTYSYDENNFFHNDALYFISNASKYLVAILNSTTSWWFLKRICTDLQNGYLQALSQYQAQIPIPDAKDWQKEIIEKFVDYILFLTKTNSEKLIVNYFESIINALVYELFLTDELHKAEKEFFKPLKSEKLPDLTDYKGNELKVIRELFARLSDINHVVRKNIYFLDNIESVRIIEGKQ